MCGRYSLIAYISGLQERFDFDGSELTHVPRYNIAPTQMALSVTNDGRRRGSYMRWGLIPSWAKSASVGNRMINARAEKEALDLLSAWPLCTREQLAGLMGGVTLRRVNQVLRSLAQHGLVRSDEPLHMLTDGGLTYLARRDRAAVGLTLDRWSAEPLYLNADIYAGTAVRALASQLRHHAGVIDFVSALSAEVARSPSHDLWDLLPTSRSSIGYRYDWTTYVIHPDASFTLEYEGRWRPYLLEFERRATTPKRARSRLKSC